MIGGTATDQHELRNSTHSRFFQTSSFGVSRPLGKKKRRFAVQTVASLSIRNQIIAIIPWGIDRDINSEDDRDFGPFPRGFGSMSRHLGTTVADTPLSMTRSRIPKMITTWTLLRETSAPCRGAPQNRCRLAVLASA
jgi:hypothetical protein